MVAKALTLFSRAGASISGEAEGGFWNVDKVGPVLPATFLGMAHRIVQAWLLPLQAHTVHTSDTTVFAALSTVGCFSC